MLKLLRGVIGKVFYALLLLLAVAALNFTLVHFAPGDSAEAIAASMGGSTSEIVADLRHGFGLDRSFCEQLTGYLLQVASGNLGESFYFNAPVLHLILDRLPATALLVLSALALSFVVGVLLGVLSAYRPRSLFNHIVSVFSLVGYAAPVFWTGIVLLVSFALFVPLFPVSGMTDVAYPKSGAAYAIDVLHHLALPAVTLAILNTAQYSRLARASMLETLRADYIRTARAKGLGEWTVIGKHALRNALIPVVTLMGMHFGTLFAGAILVETVFSWPGLGRLVFESIMRRDYPLLLGILLFSAMLVVIANMLTDLAYQAIDPRIRKKSRA
ncbi:MAG: ABC transporter permease [Candidatus Accumulibacter sp.]|jgi:peptide/nickel transport system permease protein|nr:ABC transporter permease [Accumulibacter sp.]